MATNIYRFINAEAPSSGGGGSTGATTYVQTFDASSAWGSASGGFYTITITAGTHSKGVNPQVQIFENNSGSFDDVDVDRLRVDSSGNITFRVPDSPDSRFAGKINILGVDPS